MLIYIYFWILVGISSGLYAGNYVLKNRDKFDLDWLTDNFVRVFFVVVGVIFWPVIILSAIMDIVD